MTRHPRPPVFRAVLAALAVAALAGSAIAGPPLVCHPIDIDGAASLPWDGRDGWQDTDRDYDRASLEADVARLLGPATPVLVRMETLRRASLYASADAKLARRLLDDLAATAESGDPLALFDYGYAVETYRQVPGRMPGAEVDGYALVARAAELSRDPAMAFAAAVISIHPRRPALDEHLRAALEGAEAGSLLERNLLDHFDYRGTTIAALRKSAGMDAR